MTYSPTGSARGRLNLIEPTGDAVVLGGHTSGLCNSLSERGWRVHPVPEPSDSLNFDEKSISLVIADRCLHHLENAAMFTGEVARILASGGIYVSMATPAIGSAEIESTALGERQLLDPLTRRCPTVRHLILELQGAGLDPTRVHSNIEEELDLVELKQAAKGAGAIWPGFNAGALFRYFSLRREALGSSRRNIKLLPSSGIERSVLFWMSTSVELWAVKPH